MFASSPSSLPQLCVQAFRSCTYFVLLAFFAGATALLAQSPANSSKPVDPRIANVISELEKTRTIHQAALSPDSQLIAWVVDADGGTEIQIASTADPGRTPAVLPPEPGPPA